MALTTLGLIIAICSSSSSATESVAGRLLYGGVGPPDWLGNTTLVGQVMARAAAEQQAADASASRASYGGADDARRIQTMLEVLDGHPPVLNAARPALTHYCMYSERNSGSNWVDKLIEVNFELDGDPARCPHKHDLNLTVPNEFLFPASNVLVVAVFRNALDWAASMSRKPWHAGNHCNITFEEFVRREWSPGRWGVRGLFAPRRPPFCPKYEGAHARLPMLYESARGVPPADVLELRTWKARRALELCQVRLQSECVRHEDLVENTTSWLRDFQARFSLRTRPGFPIEVFEYKGVQHAVKFKPFSEFNTLRLGNGNSSYYTPDANPNKSFEESHKKGGTSGAVVEVHVGIAERQLGERGADKDTTASDAAAERSAVVVMTVGPESRPV
ncbi:hypothetical protein WJX81_002991 [Elliptochloris bilobata]|uniref:Sulfotransferase n=1 Tax=Elliptochloris bilobata TaxID=381761 RepID=A0AAW1SDP2_9CHLO